MDDDDLDLDQRPEPPKRPIGLIVAAAAVTVVAGGVAGWWFTRAPEIKEPAPATAAPSAVPDAGVIAAAAEPPGTPPPAAGSTGRTGGGQGGPITLANGDALFFKLAKGGSQSPLLARWASSESIVRRVLAGVRLIAIGDSPRAMVGFIEVPGNFVVIEELPPPGQPDLPERDFISPKAYERYDAPIAALTAVNPSYAASAYAELKPYFNAAFEEIAQPGERFDDLLIVAIDRVLAVKPIDGAIQVVPKGPLYKFKDPQLEALGPADKHVLRLGPANARALQAWLRSFAAAAHLPLAK